MFSVLRFMDSDYLFGIFKLFLTSPLFIEIPVPRGELVVMYMCVRGHVYVLGVMYMCVRAHVYVCYVYPFCLCFYIFSIVDSF